MLLAKPENKKRGSEARRPKEPTKGQCRQERNHGRLKKIRLVEAAEPERYTSTPPPPSTL